jgi:hypothetical protein
MWSRLIDGFLAGVEWFPRRRNRLIRPASPLARALEAHVVVDIDTSADESLRGRTLSGRVRACDTTMQGDVGGVLIQLDEPLAYKGHYTELSIRWIVASPCVRCEQTEDLFLASAAARIVDALSLGDVRFDRTIAVGRVRFSGGAEW